MEFILRGYKMNAKEAMDSMLKTIDELEKELKKTISQVEVMLLPFNYIDFKNVEPNVESKECIATYTASHAWQDYKYNINRVLYHMKRMIMQEKNQCNYLTEHINRSQNEENYGFYLGVGTGVDDLAYEFESMVTAFARLYEEPLIVECCRYMKHKYSKVFKENCPKRADIDGLWWRINLLRNRVVHTTPGVYSQKEDVSWRFQTISSQCKTIGFSTDSKIGLSMPSTLIDMDDKLKLLIQECILDKKYGEEIAKKNIFDILFPEQQPKGHGKNKPQMLFMGGITVFDYFDGFFDLSHKMLQHIQSQIIVFLKDALEDCDDSIYEQSVGQWDENGKSYGVKIRDVFDV